MSPHQPRVFLSHGRPYESFGCQATFGAQSTGVGCVSCVSCAQGRKQSTGKHKRRLALETLLGDGQQNANGWPYIVSPVPTSRKESGESRMRRRLHPPRCDLFFCRWPPLFSFSFVKKVGVFSIAAEFLVVVVSSLLSSASVRVAVFGSGSGSPAYHLCPRYTRVIRYKQLLRCCSCVRTR